MDPTGTSHTDIAQALDRCGLAALRWRTDGSLVALSGAAARLLGYDANVAALDAADSPHEVWEVPSDFRRWVASDAAKRGNSGHFSIKRRDGTTKPVCAFVVPSQESDDARATWVLLMDDSEALKQSALERQLARCQSIASASGAIGHKINNLLAGLLGYLGLMQRAVTEESGPLKRYVTALEESGDRFHDLAKGLMIIAQKNVSYVMKPVAPGAVVAPVVEKLTGSGSLPILLAPLPDLPAVEVDASAFQEAFEVLLSGSALVLPNVTQVRLSMTGVELSGYEAETIAIAEGSFVLVTATFDHAPVREIVRERFFDPYFTPEGKGRGAELHLSRARGIVTLHKGTVIVRSEGETTTRLDVYIPTSERDR